jgi:hypothetical protein
MPVTRQFSVKDDDVLLLVGTMKGAFLFRSNRSRARWEMGGPHFPGTVAYSLAFDDRAGRHRLWAGTWRQPSKGPRLVSKKKGRP